MHQEINHGKKIASKAAFIWGQATKAGQIRIDRRSQILTFLANLTKDTKILELGCGTGEYTKRLSKTGAKIIAVDISLDLINQAKKKVTSPGVSFVVADIDNLPFLVEGFEAVVGNAILHHLNLKRVLPAIKRVLKPGGIMAFTEPNMLNPQNLVVKNIRFVGRMVGESPGETAFFRGRLANLLIDQGFEEVLVEPFDFLHPITPDRLIRPIRNIQYLLERLALIRHIAGSLMIKGRKPQRNYLAW